MHGNTSDGLVEKNNKSARTREEVDFFVFDLWERNVCQGEEASSIQTSEARLNISQQMPAQSIVVGQFIVGRILGTFIPGTGRSNRTGRDGLHSLYKYLHSMYSKPK